MSYQQPPDGPPQDDPAGQSAPPPEDQSSSVPDQGARPPADQPAWPPADPGAAPQSQGGPNPSGRGAWPPPDPDAWPYYHRPAAPEPRITWYQAPPPPPSSLASMSPPPRRRNAGIAVVAAVLLIALGTFLGIAIANDFWRSPASSGSRVIGAGGGAPAGTGDFNFTPAAGSGPATTAGSLSSATVQSITTDVSPSIVNIDVVKSYESSRGAATGIVMTPTGLVLTNNHVIDGATQISATTVSDGHTYSATVVGYDRSHDIALIQLQNASGLQPAEFGDSSKIQAGQAVVALGNAGGDGGAPSVATGSLVALDQQITASDANGGRAEQLSGLIQTDAAIQPGDSGGPLVDGSGRVIGVDTAASSGYSFQESDAQGFAVPSNTALALATQIANQQASSTVHIGATAFLGVAVGPSGGQDLGGASASGAAVSGVLPGSPAEGAGITAGDTIVSVDGRSVGAAESLSVVLGKYHPGDRVSIGWVDQSGAQHQSTVKLATGPAG